MTDTGESMGTKACPRCAEEIKAEALVCHFCGQEFSVVHRGYCSTCHRQVEVADGTRCSTCGAEVVDVIVDSQPLAPPSPLSSPAPPPQWVPPAPAAALAFDSPPPSSVAVPAAGATGQPPKRHLVLRLVFGLVATIVLLFVLLTLVFGPKDDDGGVDQAVIDSEAEICAAAIFIAQDSSLYAQETDPVILQITARKMVADAGMVATALEDAPPNIAPRIRSAATAVAGMTSANPDDPAAVSALVDANDTLAAACSASGM